MHCLGWCHVMTKQLKSKSWQTIQLDHSESLQGKWLEITISIHENHGLFGVRGIWDPLMEFGPFFLPLRSMGGEGSSN